MSELASDDVDRDPLARNLDGVRVSELVRRESAPDSPLGREGTQFGAGGCGGPGPAAGGSVDHAQQPTDRQHDAVSQPCVELLEPEPVHAGLASLIAFAVSDQQRPSVLVDVGLAQRERFGDPQTAAPQHSDQGADPEGCR